MFEFPVLLQLPYDYILLTFNDAPSFYYSIMVYISKTPEFSI